MIAYALIIVNGSLRENFMTVAIGSSEIGLNCKEVRRFIQRANNVGIDAALDQIRPDNPEGRAVMKMMYEEFKEKL